MNGVHDMGGMHGFGPLDIEVDEPLFHHAWEGRVRSMVVLTRAYGYYNLDAFRYGIEQMPPADYLASSYFERWLATMEYNLMLEGFLEREEIESRFRLYLQHPEEPVPTWPEQLDAPPLAPNTEEVIPADTTKFRPGDAVVVKNIHPEHHTRHPRYVRGKRGVVDRVHGAEILPDDHAHHRGAHREPVYSVKFDGQELWGETAEPNQVLSIDLWESYLDPVET